ncbi:hypothetical protein D3C78_1312560 [compost metagenome]
MIGKQVEVGIDRFQINLDAFAAEGVVKNGPLKCPHLVVQTELGTAISDHPRQPSQLGKIHLELHQITPG